MDKMILLTSVASVLALIISVINIFRISYIKRKHEIDLVNHNEDVNLSMESVKFSASRDVKNLRKEMNKRFRTLNQEPQNPQVNQTDAKQEGNVPVKENVALADDAQKPKPRRNPNSNRQRNYRPKKKPIVNSPSEQMQSE